VCNLVIDHKALGALLFDRHVVAWAAVAMLLFCRCGSDRVDIGQWNGPRAQLTCYTCGQTAWLEGFTVGEFDLMRSLTGATVDQARKHRKRSPLETEPSNGHARNVGAVRPAAGGRATLAK
jgi:hypothetical protein